jgi:hypothetical protein
MRRLGGDCRGRTVGCAGEQRQDGEIADLERVAQLERIVSRSIHRHRGGHERAGGVELGADAIVAVPAALWIVGDRDLLGLGSDLGGNRLTLAVEPDRAPHERAKGDQEVEEAEPVDATLAGHRDLRFSEYAPSPGAGRRSSRAEWRRTHRSTRCRRHFEGSVTPQEGVTPHERHRGRLIPRTLEGIARTRRQCRTSSTRRLRARPSMVAFDSRGLPLP